MSRRLSLSALVLALGTSMLVAAAFAGAASSKSTKGGVMKLNMSATDVDFSDPSLAYGTISWQIEYATQLKLLNYPDKGPPLGGRLRAEAATGLPISSNNCNTYNITIKKGIRLSNRCNET